MAVTFAVIADRGLSAKVDTVNSPLRLDDTTKTQAGVESLMLHDEFRQSGQDVCVHYPEAYVWMSMIESLVCYVD